MFNRRSLLAAIGLGVAAAPVVAKAAEESFSALADTVRIRWLDGSVQEFGKGYSPINDEHMVPISFGNGDGSTTFIYEGRVDGERALFERTMGADGVFHPAKRLA